MKTTRTTVIWVVVLGLAGSTTADWITSGNGMYADTTGNVGIGTTNPQSRLSVGGNGVSGAGVYGYDSKYGGYFVGTSSTGVYAKGSNYGGYFEAEENNWGVYSKAPGSSGRAICGEALHSLGFGGYFLGRGYFSGNLGIGTTLPEARLHAVSSDGDAIRGDTSERAGRAVYGHANFPDPGDYLTGAANYGGYFVAEGHKSPQGGTCPVCGPGGTGIYAKGNFLAGHFDGRVRIDGNLEIFNPGGNDKLITLGEGLDYAEGFHVSEEREPNPGCVLVIDPENPGELRLSDEAYDTKVAGIAAGGKGLGSGVRLGGEEFDCDVALAGRVYCNVDATETAVRPGDLLTTSATTGYAMKVSDHIRAQGAILGKAMESLEQGKKGQILVLVTLQ